ncbi:MAG: CIA30 family protein [Pseudomonadota bacterium]
MKNKFVWPVLLFLVITLPDRQAEASDCEVLFDLSEEPSLMAWQTVNDNVMGGRSIGGPAFVDGTLRFQGAINTNGGGFSSIRARLQPEALTGRNALKLEIRPDARTYQVSFRTGSRYYGRPVAYRADMRSLSPGEWSETTVFFSELKPTVFGRRVRAREFDPLDARDLSLFIADGIDGEFSLSIRRISACTI